MGLFDTVKIKGISKTPMLCTGTPIDLMTGKFVPASNGQSIMYGGLATTNAFDGKAKVYKSTSTMAEALNALARYSGSHLAGWDNEESFKDERRAVEMIDLYREDPVKRQALLDDVYENRLHLSDLSAYSNANEFFEEVIRPLYNEKMKHIKDYIVETPLLDPRTGKPQLMIVPTIILQDSWSKARVKAADDLMEKEGVGNSGNNTYYMKSGLVKNQLMSYWPKYAGQAGFYFVSVAQLKEKTNMTGKPNSKDMQFGKQDEKMSEVGSDYTYVNSNMIELRSAKVMLDSSGTECEFPFEDGVTSVNELSEVTNVLVSCKNHGSGSKMQMVMSSERGLCTFLTNLKYLKTMKTGLGSNNQFIRPELYPDGGFRRKEAWSIQSNYKVVRAIELMTQLIFIQQNWTLSNPGADYGMTIEELSKKIGESSYAMDDILNSRGWWTYDKNDRPYLSIKDVLLIASGNYKPKFIKSAEVPKAA